MRILQLTKYYPPQMGGIESATFDITEGLNTAGIPCDVLCAHPGSKTVIEEHNGYKIFRVGSVTTISATSIAPKMVSLLAKLMNSYDILQVHFPNPMVALAIFLSRPKAKIIVHWHSDIIRQRKLYFFYQHLEQWVLRRADVIIGTSNSYIDASRALAPYKHKVVSVPLGISTDRFIWNDVSVANIKRKYKNKNIVFGLGRLVYYKGFEQLIQAAEFLNDDTIVLIGGEGELRDELQHLINERGVQNKVKLLGRVSDAELASYYQACDVFCLPSTKRSEAFGVVQLEAMYFGKPIVATNIEGSGVNWVNQHGVTGINVAVSNPHELATALTTILCDKQLAKQYSEASKSRFNDLFTQEKMVNKLSEVYQKLLAKSIVLNSNILKKPMLLHENAAISKVADGIR